MWLSSSWWHRDPISFHQVVLSSSIHCLLIYLSQPVNHRVEREHEECAPTFHCFNSEVRHQACNKLPWFKTNYMVLPDMRDREVYFHHIPRERGGLSECKHCLCHENLIKVLIKCVTRQERANGWRSQVTVTMSTCPHNRRRDKLTIAAN